MSAAHVVSSWIGLWQWATWSAALVAPSSPRMTAGETTLDARAMTAHLRMQNKPSMSLRRALLAELHERFESDRLDERARADIDFSAPSSLFAYSEYVTHLAHVVRCARTPVQRERLAQHLFDVLAAHRTLFVRFPRLSHTLRRKMDHLRKWHCVDLDRQYAVLFGEPHEQATRTTGDP